MSNFIYWILGFLQGTAVAVCIGVVLIIKGIL